MGNDKSFRDSLSTVGEEGNRNWIYAKKPSGKLYNYRQAVAYFLIGFFLVAPFVRINGEQFLLFNILQRKFVVFGQVFHPQDFHLFVLAMLIFMVFIVLFTIIYGRVWCGWACPQTVFMEMVFRRIEYFIEGNANKQRKRDRGELTFDRLWRKTIKHLVFLSLAFIIGNISAAYLIGTNTVFQYITEGPSEHWGSFLAVFIFSLVFYGVFAWLREQACTLICPYGRLQGALLDSDSIVVAYDYKRGEPRAPFRKMEDRKQLNKGDCVSCNSCVLVCPTGIDIRNGTQLECVNCTACIDACNKVMDKTGLPKGLIRFASENEIEDGRKFKFTGRMALYTTVLSILLILFTSLIFIRGSIETTVLRVPGMLYQDVGADSISNLYNLKVMNKKAKEVPLYLQLIEPKEGKIRYVGNWPVVAEGNERTEGVFFVVLPKSLLNKELSLEFGIYSGDELLETKSSSFVGPIKNN